MSCHPPVGRNDRSIPETRTPWPETGRLDYAWWASDGPSAGYLASLALDQTAKLAAAVRPSPRGIDLYLLHLPAADKFEATTAVASGDGALAVTTFEQGRPFAVAAVHLSAGHGATATAATAEPPRALPPDAYRLMPTATPTLPPVTRHFNYRPAADADGTTAKPGWDLVWLEPRGDAARGAGDVMRMIDCWYPAHFMLAVRDHLRQGGTAETLQQPPPTRLTSAHLMFPSHVGAYKEVRHALLATRAIGETDGHHFEQAELWSENGELLIAASLARHEAGLRPS